MPRNNNRVEALHIFNADEQESKHLQGQVSKSHQCAGRLQGRHTQTICTCLETSMQKIGMVREGDKALLLPPLEKPSHRCHTLLPAGKSARSG